MVKSNLISGSIFPAGLTGLFWLFSVFKCGALLNQFAMDMDAKIEGERLRFIRPHQSKIRVEDYSHLRDAVSNDFNPDDISHVILPSTFIGGPRHMNEYAQDAMAYGRQYGRPDLFITMTCNPKWDDIVKLIPSEQSSIHRHDITERVLRQKHLRMIDVIIKLEIFEPVDARCTGSDGKNEDSPSPTR